MPYLVRYAGSRSGRYRPTTRQRIHSELRMYMSADEADAALSRLGEGATVRTRSATYRYQSEPLITEE